MTDLLPISAELSPKAYEEQRKARAKVLYDFLMEARHEQAVTDVSVDREEMLAWADALRSRYFFDLIEASPDLPYEIKANVAGYFTTMNKGWSAIRQIILENDQLPLMALAFHKVVRMGDRALNAVGVRVVTDAEFHEITPE